MMVARGLSERLGGKYTDSALPQGELVDTELMCWASFSYL